jgi:hypothetical protein
VPVLVLFRSCALTLWLLTERLRPIHASLSAAAADSAGQTGMDGVAAAAQAMAGSLLEGTALASAAELLLTAATTLAPPAEAAAAAAVATPVGDGRAVHERVTCDGCKACPIVGARFKCLTCDDYDLCEACEALGTHDREHPMVKMYQPHRTIDMGSAGFGLLGPSRVPRFRRPHAMCMRMPVGPEAAAAVFGRSEAEARVAKRDKHATVRFVRDATCPPGTQVALGRPFHKVWMLRNDGAEQWPAGCRLEHVGGDLLGCEGSVAVPSAAPGQEVSVAVGLSAPAAPGRYVGYWRVVGADGKRFGQRIACDVVVA